ncbi:MULTISPECIES: hypothetical protein [Brucella/Ochrobactrum group]|jgi:hypothetical protein|uniref:hypothetical protein n=1 Tax=Brucella/Ochrobactrum group TaxID=2826938 RepID=UPI000D707BB8|nr:MULTISPECIES: hypothetical protein [Brucella/Ochrobactrum group]MCH4541238.1 hypothetical protein [Ochrobactrum sp. A-1]PWU75336.1 hypothetical protein DK867_07335 [Ochrobactrum sp. POC9]
MQARTERRLGIAAALVLTAGAFVMPGVSTQIVQNDVAPQSQIHMASAENLRAELRHFINLGEAMPKSVRYE